jgi:hypothetical protein
MQSPPTGNPPHEPEIEALGRAAHGFLWLVRRVFWLAGLGGVAYGLWRCWADHGAVPSAKGVVWVGLGFPALLPVGWTFGRGRWLVLAVSAVLWFGAMALPDDHRYGFVLRIVATFVAAATLLVWRTLWRLTSTAAAGRHVKAG